MELYKAIIEGRPVRVFSDGEAANEYVKSQIEHDIEHVRLACDRDYWNEGRCVAAVERCVFPGASRRKGVLVEQVAGLLACADLSKYEQAEG